MSDAFPFGGLRHAEPNAVRQCGSATRSRSGNWDRQPPLPTAVAAFCLADDARNLTVLREAQHVRRFVYAVGAPPTVAVRASGVARIGLAVPTYLYELNAVRAGTQGASRGPTLTGNRGPTLGSTPSYTRGWRLHRSRGYSLGWFPGIAPDQRKTRGQPEHYC
jgi:hypothetical protein